MAEEQTFRNSPGPYFSHHSLPHHASQFRSNNQTSFQSAQSTPRVRPLQNEGQASYTTPSSPYHAAKQRYSNNDEDEEPDLIAANSRQGYRHSIHGGDVFSTAILEGSMTAGENNASEITVIENRANNWTANAANSSNVGNVVNVSRRGSSSNQSRASLNSNASFQHGGHVTGYQIVVQGVSGPVAHDVHSDHDVEVDDDDDDCQVSSEDNLSHDSYELIEREGLEGEGGSQRGSKENVMMSQSKNASPPPHTSLTSAEASSGQNLNVGQAVAFPRMKSNDSFSQESDHNASINRMARINNLLMDNCGGMGVSAQMFASDNDDFQGHEVTLQRPPQTPEERMMVDIVRKRGLQLQMKPARQAAANTGTRSLPRYLTQRAPDLVSGPPPTAYPFGRKHVYNYTSRTLPSNQRRDKSPVYYTRGGLLGPGECSSGSSSSHASPKISRPKSLEFAVVAGNNVPNQNASYSYRDDSLDKQNNLLEYDDSSISGACGVGPLMQYATSSSDVPQTPENPNYPHLPVDKVPPNYNRCYQDEHIYDVPESIEPADITSPSSSSGITDSFPRPSVNIAYDHFQRQQNIAPPLPKEAPPPLPVHPQPIIAPRFVQQQVGFVDQSQPVAPRPRTHFMNPPRAKPGQQKPHPQPKNVHLLISMSSTESESALSARSAPTPVVGILEDRAVLNAEEIPEPVLVVETSIKEDLSEEVPAISVNLISPPEESESSTAVMDSDGRIPAPPPEFSGAAVISDADMQEATDVDEDGDENEEEKSGSASGIKLANEPVETATVSQESEYVTVVARQMNRGNSLRCFKADSLDIVDHYEDEPHSSVLNSEHIAFFEPEGGEAEAVAEERTKMITFNEEDEYIENVEDGGSSPENGARVDDVDDEDKMESQIEEAAFEEDEELQRESFDVDAEADADDLVLRMCLEDEERKLRNENDEIIENEESIEGDFEHIDEGEKGDFEEDNDEEEEKTEETDFDIDNADDYDNNTMIRVKEKSVKVEQEEAPDQNEENVEQKETVEEEKSPSNGEEESEVIKIGEMYMRLDNGSTLSENVSGADEDNSNIEEEILEHYAENGNREPGSEEVTIEQTGNETEAEAEKSDAGNEQVGNDGDEIKGTTAENVESGNKVQCVLTTTFQVMQQPEKVFIPSPSPDPSSEQNTKTEDVSPAAPPPGPSRLPSLPSLPTGDSASSLGLDLIPLPPPPVAEIESCADETITFPSPPPEIATECDEMASSKAVRPKVTIMTSSPAPEMAATEVFSVTPHPRALSRISERSNSDAAVQSNPNIYNIQQPASPRSASPPSEASKGPAEDTMSDQNYASSENGDNENPPSLCSDLPENTNVRTSELPVALPRFQSFEKEQFPSPPSSMLEGSATIQECGTEMTQIEPDSLFLELSPPEEEEEEYLRGEAELEGEQGDGGSLERRREKIPYDFSISSENDVTNKEDEDSGSSLHGSMEILEEVATEDHFEHDDTNTDTDDGGANDVDVDVDVHIQQKDIFEMSPLDAALQERVVLAEQQQQQLLQEQQQQQQQRHSIEPCDLYDLPPLRSRGNEYIL